MTALNKYQRLECSGLWRAAPDAQRRDVTVAFREATLVMADPRSQQPLSHWSLPAVQRMNPGQLPALYSPDAGTSEMLELDDPDMIAALDTVQNVLERRRPHPGRLRNWIILGVLASISALAVFWLPGAMSRHAALVLPQATRAEIGQAALEDLMRLTGSPCAAPLGRKAQTALAARLAPAGVRQIVVVRDGVAQALALPGGIVVLNRALVEQAQDAETAAGFALVEALRAEATDPMVRLLAFAGPIATTRLLATGRLPQGVLDGYAETLLAQSPPPLPASLLGPAFKAQSLSLQAYANALQDSTLLAADPFPAGSPAPVLADRDWVSLQAICAG
jgi:hypothetical protein